MLRDIAQSRAKKAGGKRGASVTLLLTGLEMIVETVTRKHAANMLKQPKAAVRRDTISRLQDAGIAVNRILNMLPSNGPVLHSKECAVNARVYALMRDIDELRKLVATLERE